MFTYFLDIATQMASGNFRTSIPENYSELLFGTVTDDFENHTFSSIDFSDTSILRTGNLGSIHVNHVAMTQDPLLYDHQYEDVRANIIHSDRAAVSSNAIPVIIPMDVKGKCCFRPCGDIVRRPPRPNDNV